MSSKVIVRGLNCPVARSLEIIGDRWTVLILRDLFMDGPKKNLELQNSLQGISPNILSDRLKKLIQFNIIERAIYSENPPRYEYKLSKKGLSLRPILEELRDWGKANTSS